MVTMMAVINFRMKRNNWEERGRNYIEETEGWKFRFGHRKYQDKPEASVPILRAAVGSGEYSHSAGEPRLRQERKREARGGRLGD